MVVNVAGPWVDAVLAGSSLGQQSRLIGGSKGSHIIVDSFPGAPHDALYAEARQDGRPFFIIPWNDLYLIGTTDTRYDGDLDKVMAGLQQGDGTAGQLLRDKQLYENMNGTMAEMRKLIAAISGMSAVCSVRPIVPQKRATMWLNSILK